ncbi:Mur ligase domain-containing protein [Exiguobacterium acetylicum]|uniref:Mur ligase domain-containing protein n=1 Tax=Exiguobacterium acetylicum TaxID=41170 RepID=UPI00397749D3
MSRLAKLLTELLPITINEAINPIITNIATDSRQITPGGLFICINGYTVDGHDYIDQAINNGAVAILADRSLPDSRVPVITVPDTKRLAGQVADRFYDQPSQKNARLRRDGDERKNDDDEIGLRSLSINRCESRHDQYGRCTNR